MRELARQIFQHALAEANIARAFDRYVELNRGVLRVGEVLFDLDSYTRHFVVSIGKAANTMVEALAAKAGERFEGIVASPDAPGQQVRGYLYFPRYDAADALVVQAPVGNRVVPLEFAQVHTSAPSRIRPAPPFPAVMKVANRTLLFTGSSFTTKAPAPGKTLPDPVGKFAEPPLPETNTLPVSSTQLSTS